MNRKIARNDSCPCGTRSKFKHCCLGKVDWDALQAQPLDVASRHLSLRGKNLIFLGSVLESLNLNDSFEKAGLVEFKRRVTPDVVEKTFSLIPLLWPDIDDFERIAEAESGLTTALYTGSYEPFDVFKAITRLSLYCDRILLVDPFIRPTSVRPEFSPLNHPEEHRATTVKFLYLWMTLWPWIDAGIVSFIRPLHDFVPGLWHDIIDIQENRIKKNPKLKRILDMEVKERMSSVGPLDRGMGEMHLLQHSDDALLRMFKGFGPGELFKSKEDFCRYIRKRREQHPYYVDRIPGQTSEFHQETSGSCYELAKRMCSLTNSHIVTNFKARWKEVEIDREAAGIDLQGWSPFSKALQSSAFKALDNVPIRAALKLREEQRLQSMRYFLRRVWKDCSNPDSFSEENAVTLAAELADQTAIANDEWSKIDRDLLKWLGGTAGALISSGIVGFVPAASAAAVAGVTGLIDAQIKRSSFKERFPAGFFLGLDKK
ncbi:MAG: SEC-C metal-binding domain-containing protein [Verrucomicrobiae bacterium]